MRAGARQRVSAAAAAVVLAAVAVVLLPDRASACSCDAPHDPVEQVGLSDVAVVATVIGSTVHPARDGDERDHLWYRTDRLLVEAVVADDPASTIDRGMVLEVLTLGDCGGARRDTPDQAVLLHRVHGRLYAVACLGPATADELLAAPIDLPPPPSTDAVQLLTVGIREGPSDLQLRDVRGAVVAWGALPPHSSLTSLCPGAAMVSTLRWDPTTTARSTALVDLRTLAARSTASDADQLRTGCEPVGAPIVRVDSAGSDQPPVLKVTDPATAHVERTELPDGRATLVATTGGPVTVTSDASLLRVDPTTGAVSTVVDLPPGTFPRATVPLVHGGVSVLLGDRAGDGPITRLLTTSADLTTATVAPVHGQPWVVSATALPDGSLLVTDLQNGSVLLAPDGTTLGHLDEPMPTDQQRRFTRHGAAWIAVTDGELRWSAPGDPTADVVVPILSNGSADKVRFVPPRSVDERVAAVHTRDALRARATPPGGSDLLPAAPNAPDDRLAVGLVGLATVGAALAAFGAVVSLRRRAARPLGPP